MTGRLVVWEWTGCWNRMHGMALGPRFLPLPRFAILHHHHHHHDHHHRLSASHSYCHHHHRRRRGHSVAPAPASAPQTSTW